MKSIPLSQGHLTWVDTEDYPKASKYRWYANKRGNVIYAVRSIKLFGKRITIQLHRFLLGVKGSKLVDHIDGNGLNNCKTNLRVCRNKDNVRNARKQLNRSSRFKGVARNKATGKWEAYITVNYQRKYLGLFVSELDAANAYNEAASKYFKEFARLNREGRHD